AARALPAAPAGGAARAAGGGSLWAPLRRPGVAGLLALSAAVQGSHVVYYGYSTLHWTAAGLSAAQVGLLWGLGVLAEVWLFWRGGALAARLGARGLALLAAGAGVLRWSLCALTAEFWALVPVTALHGLTFGAMHLAAMRALRALPAEMAGRAQTLHSAAVGAGSAALMLAAGALYAWLGGGAFWAMSLLCALALPLAARLRSG
ncbi:MFS transporter, partial [Roseococcus sp. DSY-14]|uniref:MFS transporter n=1 Tax=Roseococcus sp. DSY-14 TaxID=3369650 RepID=UPI00387B9AD1